MAGLSRIWKVIMIWWITANSFVISPPRNKQYLLQKKVAFIPRNEREFMEQTKFLKCAYSEGDKLYPTYVINPFHNETSLGCFPETHVTVKKCLEYNEKNDEIFIQPSILAGCDDFSLTPCKGYYSSTKSYELFQCFEKYGGILSPKEKQMRIEHLEREINQTKCIKEIDYLTNKTNEIVSQQENADLHSHNDIHVVAYIGIALVRLCILLMLVIFIIPFCIQMCRKKVKFRDFWKYCFRILKSLVSIWTADMIQDSLSGQVSNTDKQGTPTDKLRTEDDTGIWEDIA